eukprot:scaffold439601_cov21-Prasinocladus_malaysianus.AAC.1
MANGFEPKGKFGALRHQCEPHSSGCRELLSSLTGGWPHHHSRLLYSYPSGYAVVSSTQSETRTRTVPLTALVRGIVGNGSPVPVRARRRSSLFRRDELGGCVRAGTSVPQVLFVPVRFWYGKIFDYITIRYEYS